MNRVRHLLKGDLHLHTINSDGVCTPEELYEMCYQKGLDFAIITDHNANTPGEHSFNYKGVNIIPGAEISGKLGHVNVWGENLPEISRERPSTEEEYDTILSAAKNAGALISVNHPFDKKIPWKYDIENMNMDCVEVWNAPMHIDDVTNINWWHKKLCEGKFIPAVGGSDYHKDYVVTSLLASPATYVYAYSNETADIFDALKKGNCVITNSPRAGLLTITCEDAVAGDSVEFTGGASVQVADTKLKKGYRLQVFQNDKKIFEHTAKKTAPFSAKIEVTEKGFVFAKVTYEYGKLVKKLYSKIIPKIFSPDKGVPVPEFVFSLTNPIFFK